MDRRIRPRQQQQAQQSRYRLHLVSKSNGRDTGPYHAANQVHLLFPCVEEPDRPSPFGSRFMARAVPVTPNATGRMVTPFSMRMAPALVPVAVGAKFTVMVQVPFTAMGDEDTHVSVAE